MATWNIIGLNRKEAELVEEIIKVNVDILYITEINKKGEELQTLEDVHILTCSGMDKKQAFDVYLVDL